MHAVIAAATRWTEVSPPNTLTRSSLLPSDLSAFKLKLPFLSGALEKASLLNTQLAIFWLSTRLQLHEKYALELQTLRIGRQIRPGGSRSLLSEWGSGCGDC